MTDTQTVALIVAGVSAVAALGGSLGSQLISRFGQREQLEHDRQMDATRAQRETASELRAKRQIAYEAFLACYHRIAVRRSTGASTLELSKEIEELVTNQARISMLSSPRVRDQAAKAVAALIASVAEGDPAHRLKMGQGVSEWSSTGDFFDAIREELQGP